MKILWHEYPAQHTALKNACSLDASQKYYSFVPMNMNIKTEISSDLRGGSIQFNIIIALKMQSDWPGHLKRFNVILTCKILFKDMNTPLANFSYFSALSISILSLFIS